MPTQTRRPTAAEWARGSSIEAPISLLVLASSRVMCRRYHLHHRSRQAACHLLAPNALTVTLNNVRIVSARIRGAKRPASPFQHQARPRFVRPEVRLGGGEMERHPIRSERQAYSPAGAQEGGAWKGKAGGRRCRFNQSTRACADVNIPYIEPLPPAW